MPWGVRVDAVLEGKQAGRLPVQIVGVTLALLSQTDCLGLGGRELALEMIRLHENRGEGS